MLTLRSKGSDYHHGDLRDSSIAAGRKLIAKGGLHALGIRKVAETIGVSPASLYRHFEDLNAFQEAISLSVREDLGEYMERETRNIKDPERKLRALGNAYIDYASKNPRLFEVAFLRCETQNKPEAKGKGWDLLQNGLHAFSTKEIKGLDFALWSLVHGFATLVAQGSIKLSEFEDRKKQLLLTTKKIVEAYTG